jgi:mono/diheme cytochrome c family protein
MKRSLKTPVLFLALVFVLGLPPALVLTAPPAPPERTQAPEQQPLTSLLRSRSTLHERYQQWETAYLAQGGDANVTLRLGNQKGLATEPLRLSGTARLDLLAGRVAVAVEGVGNQAFEVWLVDNQPVPGDSVMPQETDHLVGLGALDRSGHLSIDLGDDFFRSFEVDLVVVTRAGQRPTESRLLLGSRPLFERLYTQTRMTAQATRPRLPFAGALASLLTPPVAQAAPAGLVEAGLVSAKVARGGDLFFRGTFGGNGRSCGTCHPVVKNQEIGPAFIATLSAKDPLFVAEFPPSMGGVPGLEIPVLMRQFGLILENVDGFEPDPTVRFVMRGVPHSLSQATSILAPPDGRGPVERTGWSGDGAPGDGSLRMFPVGAVRQHYTKSLNRVEGVDFILPNDSQLDAMVAFMLTTGRVNELDLAMVTLNDAAAANGRLLFQGTGKCNGCHGNAGANSPFTMANNNFDTGIEAVPDPSQAVHPHPQDGGWGIAPVDTDGDGYPDIFGDGTFNTTPLVEAADTGPFFHNNVFTDLESAVGFYSSPEFNGSPAGVLVGGIALSNTETADVAAFLRVVNAAFNIDQAVQRSEAALTLLTNTASSISVLNTINTLMELAIIELRDARTVLVERGLSAGSVAKIDLAIECLKEGRLNTNPAKKAQKIHEALEALKVAKSGLGTGLGFRIGEANLLF